MSTEDPDPYTIRKLHAADIEPTARLLALTFLDNPVYVFMHPRVRPRVNDLRRFFDRSLHWRAHLGLTWVVVDGEGAVRGTATLEPPGGVPHSRLGLLRHWVLPTLREQGPRGVARILRTEATFARTYCALGSAARYWHVHAVAIDPRVRGRGIGSQLLRRVLGTLDVPGAAEPAPILLSTQRERNVGLYRRHGFHLLAEVSFHGYSSWFMRRAQSAAAREGAGGAAQ